MFFQEICNIFKNTYFYRSPSLAGSGARKAPVRSSDPLRKFWSIALKSNRKFINTYYSCMAGMAEIGNHVVVVFCDQYSIPFRQSG